MKLLLSKSLFTRTSSHLDKNDNFNLRLLYKLESGDSEEDWLCSYRNHSELTYKYFDSNFTVPSHLKFAGFLVDTKSHFDVNNLESLNVDLKSHKEFYLLVVENDSDNVFSLNDSFLCYKVTLDPGNQVNTPVPLEHITWVEDDESELKRKNLTLVNVSLLLFSKLPLKEEGEPHTFHSGFSTLDKLPGEVSSVLVESLKSHLSKFSSEESTLPVTFSEPFEPVKDKLSEFYTTYTLGFGFDSRGRKHALVVSGQYEDCGLCLRLVLQNNVLVQLDSEDEDDSLTNSVLKGTHEQLSRLCLFLDKDSPSLYLYVSTDHNPEDETFFKESNEEEVPVETRESRPNRTSGKKSSNKGKGSKTTQKSTPSKKTQKNTVFNFLPTLEVFGENLSLKLDTTTGGLSFTVNKESKDKGTEEKTRTNLNLVFKFLMSSLGPGQEVPFGGASVPLFNFLSDSRSSPDGVLRTYEQSLKLRLVYNPFDLVDRTVLFSPHRAGNSFPPWISPKKSTVYTVEGNYQYYHYTQLGVNDTGWGCCYRSLQLVCSWYLLQYKTPKLVPTHSMIQQVLKDNDLSHKDLRIGSSTWIGTVESGYFLNWYLDYTYKTLYLSDVSEFRNYNVVIADHFRAQGTPVMVGAGAYAYVILGICLESEQGEVAYLIADPHYTGEDSVKNVLTKGGIGWKKVDFLSKAAEGKFINLCLPQLDKYSA